jgi:NAD(P)-dependent dehydrogenase (short-subunit alcohol dehydrogenase family)
MPEEAVSNFGEQVPMRQAGQPAELATAFVILADPLSSYTSGTTVATLIWDVLDDRQRILLRRYACWEGSY